MTDANVLIELVIDFMFEWHVPFAKGYELLPKDEQYFIYQCCRHRVCLICGLPAEGIKLDIETLKKINVKGKY